MPERTCPDASLPLSCYLCGRYDARSVVGCAWIPVFFSAASHKDLAERVYMHTNMIMYIFLRKAYVLKYGRGNGFLLGEMEMPGTIRRKMFHPRQLSIAHCYNKFVRDLYMLGKDARLGEDFGHRQTWMIGMQETLAGLFAIDIVGNATMDNHIHCLLRNRPDVVDHWSDMEVVVRWLQITKLKISGDIFPAMPKEARIAEELAKGDEHLLRLRNRLCDISWFMAALSENISRRINAEEGRTGTCWQGRFKSKVTCDENTALLMLMYIELNPIRASIVELLEDTDQSSAGLRLRALLSKKNGQPYASKDYRAALWLSELELDESKAVDDPSFFRSTTGKRASDKGFLRFSREQYFEMLDWAAREVRADKRGATPAHIQPILQRLGWTDDQVIELLRGQA